MKKIILILFFIILTSFSSTYATPNNPEAIKAYNEGIEFYGNNENEKSIEAFKKAISLQADFYEAYYNLAQVYLSINKQDEAITYYEKAVKLQPQDYDSCYILGELLYKKGYLSRSISYFAKIPSTSDLYEEAQKFKQKALDRQKVVLEEQTKKQEEADRLKIQELAHVTDISDIASPSGVAGDSNGNLYIASYSENRVYKIDLRGNKSIFVSENVLTGPIGLAVDKNNNIYIANYGRGNVLKVYPTGAPYIFTKILKPYCIGILGDYLFVSEQETNKVMRFKI